MTTAEISKVNNKVKALVSGALFDLFTDPDFGLELSLNQIKKKYI